MKILFIDVQSNDQYFVLSKALQDDFCQRITEQGIKGENLDK